MSSLLIWNCRGARKKETGNYLRSLIHTHDVGLVGLLETKVELLTRRDIDAIAGRNWEFFHQPAAGKSGGILILWRRDIINVTIVQAMNQCVIVTATLPDHRQWLIAFVYANKAYHVRRQAWELLAAHNGTSLPMIVGGDFNCLLRSDDKSGLSPFHYTIGSREMDEWITSSALHELHYTGPAFTWCNNKPGPDRLLSRLDRMFLNNLALDILPLAMVQHLTRVGSDHCPLLLPLGVGSPAPSHRWFRFEDVWLSYPANSLEAEISELQLLESGPTGLSADQTKTLIHKVKELNSTLGRLQTWWRQRAKVRWLTEGDSNTAYFHSMASNRRRCNRINQVLDMHGELTDDPAAIEATFLHFFEQKWLHVTPTLDGWPSLADKPALSDVARHSLLRTVTEDDIWNAVKSMKPNRSPGADGVTSSFLTHFWSLVKTDVCRAVMDFFALGVMDPSWKETLVVLLPKSPNAHSPELFRPISLCSIFYKIVANLLVQRLQHILPSLISEEQGAFVPGRQKSLTNASLLRRSFTNSVSLQRRRCISSPSFSLLLNGLRSRPIVEARGFRQGCPLSPYLFILCSELLSLAFQQHGPDLGIVLSYPGPRISHLLYADDILIFSEASTLVTNKWKKTRLTRLIGFPRVEEFTYLGIKLALWKLHKADYADFVRLTHRFKLGVLAISPLRGGRF
ncbi:hypothetical protein KSP39_PZI003968 [Platanthera zijinensis]|uniref:Reverse transcriptase domain-containing protein n=1 Tax=Platanthera zijinensis TaxID=2320716 RepID=A0AAP0BVJ2_9ASPA